MFGKSQKQSDAWHHLHNPAVREVFFGGGARSGKSILLCAHEINEAATWPGTRGLVAREEFTALQDSTMKTFFEEVIPMMGYQAGEHFTYNGQDKTISWANGSETLFRHLQYQPRDPNYSRIGSTAYTRVSVDEADEVDPRLVDMLRGRTGFKEPPHGGKMLVTGNPGEYWTKLRYVYDKDNQPVPFHPERRVILATVKDNPDPVARARYTALMEEYTDPYDKARLLYGDWLAGHRTGKEFFHMFDTTKHVKNLAPYNPSLPLHISLDFNAHPYMTLVCFQISKKDHRYIVQGLKEYCLEHPLNTTEKVCVAFKTDLLTGCFAGHKAGLFYYGDYSGKNRDPNAREGIRHNYDTVEVELGRWITDSRLRPNPLHVKARTFMNAIFAGKLNIDLYLDPKMSNTVRDFTSVKQDADGGILKETAKDRATGIRYEKVGHTSQATYYMVCSAFVEQFSSYT